MSKNGFRVGNYEYRFHAVKTTNGWTTKVVETNHGVTPLEERMIDGALEFSTEVEAIAFAEKNAHKLADSHLK